MSFWCLIPADQANIRRCSIGVRRRIGPSSTCVEGFFSRETWSTCLLILVDVSPSNNSQHFQGRQFFRLLGLQQPFFMFIAFSSAVSDLERARTTTYPQTESFFEEAHNFHVVSFDHILKRFQPLRHFRTHFSPEPQTHRYTHSFKIFGGGGSDDSKI